MCLFLTVAISAQSFYEGFSEEERSSLAYEYYLVSKAYVESGKADKAAAFKTLAFNIYPQLEADIEAGNMTSYESAFEDSAVETDPAEKEIAKTTFSNIVGKAPGTADEQAINMVEYTFNKMLRGFVNENPAVVLDTLSEAVLIPSYSETPLSQAEIQPMLTQYMEIYDLQGKDPRSFYDLSSMEIIGSSEDLIELKINVAVEVNMSENGLSNLSFWSPTQVFTYTKSGDTWKLSDIQAPE